MQIHLISGINIGSLLYYILILDIYITPNYSLFETLLCIYSLYKFFFGIAYIII